MRTPGVWDDSERSSWERVRSPWDSRALARRGGRWVVLPVEGALDVATEEREFVRTDAGIDDSIARRERRRSSRVRCRQFRLEGHPRYLFRVAAEEAFEFPILAESAHCKGLRGDDLDVPGSSVDSLRADDEGPLRGSWI